MNRKFRYTNNYFLNSDGYTCNQKETNCKPGYYGHGVDDPFVKKVECVQENNVFWPQCILDVSKIKTEQQASLVSGDFGRFAVLPSKFCTDNPKHPRCNVDVKEFISRWFLINSFMILILILTIWFVISNKPCKKPKPEAITPTVQPQMPIQSTTITT